VPRISPETKKGAKWSIPRVDAPVGKPLGHIDRFSGRQALKIPLAFGVLHHHHPLPLKAELDLGSFQDPVKVSLGHEIFVADFPRVGDTRSEGQVARCVRHAQIVKFIYQRIFFVQPRFGRFLIRKHLFDIRQMPFPALSLSVLKPFSRLKKTVNAFSISLTFISIPFVSLFITSPAADF
jgi:hypothetical protein